MLSDARAPLADVDKRTLLLPMLWALLASSIIWESDIYRYLTVAVVVYAFARHRAVIKQASSDWLAILCFAWATYVLLRFIVGLLIFGEKGSSEWLYAFPAFFPLLGAALYATRRHIFLAASLLVVAGLVALLITLNYEAIIHGERAAPLFHQNPIHAGIGSSMLFISSMFWMLYAAETKRLTRRWKFPILSVGSATALLSLLGVLGAHSKGAWLAFAAAICFMGILSLYSQLRRWRTWLISAVAVAAVATSTLALPYIHKVAGPTISAADELAENALAGPLVAMESAVADPDTPNAMRQRLMFWMSAYEVIEASPLVGWGNLWLREWREGSQQVRHTLIHNGYLEILVRHGAVGMAFLLTFAIAAAKRVSHLHREGVITSSLTAYLCVITFFFFWTLATNSNNRLAIGESFFLLAGSTIFSLTLLNQRIRHG